MGGARAGTKIKICGLNRPCDIDYVNEAGPDFAGFVIDFPKSHRNVTPHQAAKLRERLQDGILPVGVFVDEDPKTVSELLRDGTIAFAQLHGREDEAYIARLREYMARENSCCGKIVQAFRITEAADVQRAQKSSADYILLDNGQGTGKVFDWGLLCDISRPWFLAGGLTPDNLSDAIRRVHPWAVDLSSGVETDRRKDREKILAAVREVHLYRKEGE